MKDYWAIRAQKYNNLEWTKKKVLLNELVTFCNLTLADRVLDAGCGTGTVSKEVVGLVSKVYAVDKSKDMLSKIGKHDNICVLCEDIEKDVIVEGFFDKIIARMVFHHINDLPGVFKNCHKMLTPNGWLVVQEGGVMPKKDTEVFKWYEKMIALKEDRHNFTNEELRGHFKQSGYINIEDKIVIDKDFSINNWLNSSGQDKDMLKKVYDLHYNAPEEIKKYYNMRIVDKEITIDSPVFMIKGQKKS
jgi:SAM-dependent methyltransferase